MPNTALLSPTRPLPVIIVVAVFAVLLGGAAALWAYYGPTVFFEMLAAGLAYCF